MTEQEKRADALEKGLAFYRAVLSLNGQGVSRPIPLRLSQMIQLLFNEEGRRAVLAVTRSLQTAQPQARTVEAGKPQGASQRQQRQARENDALPQTVNLSGKEMTPDRAARMERRKQAATPLQKRQKENAAADNPIITQEEIIAELSRPEFLALTDSELSEITNLELGGAAIVKQYGEARVLATLKDFEVLESDTVGRSANQLGNLLKKKLKEWEN